MLDDHNNKNIRWGRFGGKGNLKEVLLGGGAGFRKSKKGCVWTQ